METFYHSFKDLKADVPFDLDLSHLNPLHVLPCGFLIETIAKFKEEVKDDQADDTDGKGGE